MMGLDFRLEPPTCLLSQPANYPSSYLSGGPSSNGWARVGRVASSAAFSKSARLRDFLPCVGQRPNPLRMWGLAGDAGVDLHRHFMSIVVGRYVRRQFVPENPVGRCCSCRAPRIHAFRRVVIVPTDRTPNRDKPAPWQEMRPFLHPDADSSRLAATQNRPCDLSNSYPSRCQALVPPVKMDQKTCVGHTLVVTHPAVRRLRMLGANNQSIRRSERAGSAFRITSDTQSFHRRFWRCKERGRTPRSTLPSRS